MIAGVLRRTALTAAVALTAAACASATPRTAAAPAQPSPRTSAAVTATQRTPTLAAASDSSSPSVPGTATGGATPARTPTGRVPTSAATGAPGPAGAPSAAGAEDLVLSDAQRQQLVGAFTTAEHLSPADVAGTGPGSVYYGYLPSTRTSWAVADFAPSRSAQQRGSSDPDGGPLLHFQDGPFVFTRSPGAAWHLVTDTGGLLCPSQVPPALLAVWHVAVSSDCR